LLTPRICLPDKRISVENPLQPCLTGAANLAGARGLTAKQLLQTLTDETTILPNGTFGPYVRRSGAERPLSSALNEQNR
jgi:hypothetical protein